jgi:hypothetical protein
MTNNNILKRNMRRQGQQAKSPRRLRQGREERETRNLMRKSEVTANDDAEATAKKRAGQPESEGINEIINERDRRQRGSALEGATGVELRSRSGDKLRGETELAAGAGKGSYRRARREGVAGERRGA